MKRVKICLACSVGGHWRQLQLAVGDIPKERDCYWLTYKTKSTKIGMKSEEHVFLRNFQPHNKWSLIVNCMQSLFWLLVKRPNVIISTGAGVAVPTIYFGKKLFNAKVIYIASAANVTNCSRTPIWAEKYSDAFFIQWEEMKELFPNATHIGVL
ncbi:MAG: hypothetical protein R3Y59_08995 [bacterium]